MPLLPKNSLFQMVIDCAVVSFALTIVTQGMTYLIIYFLQEMRLI
jgi:hypothetical protein